MCGIAGFCSFNVNFREEASRWYGVLQKMNHCQKHRGPDSDGLFLDRSCGLSHTRLSVLDLNLGSQPMTRQLGNRRATIVYNGEIYNMPTLRKELERGGIHFTTSSDTEVILLGWLLHGSDYITKLNGIFAFSIWDETHRRLYLFRDRLGVKPLFFTHFRNTFLFSSELKGILCFPDFKAQVDRDGLCEVFGLGPAKTYGSGVFKDIAELLPGHYLKYYGSDFCMKPYWKLKSCPHTDTWEQTVEKTRYLVTDSIKMQMLSDVPICTFLSGGVDSSLVTAVCGSELQKQGKRLDTYSFGFKDNDRSFRANRFQSSQDKPWVDRMIAYCRTNHQYLECSSTELFDCLFDAVDARDLPCMADIESSMLYFCKRVARNHKVALTGECADEIFGGYPWFHQKECLEADCFPWSMDFAPRTMLLKDTVLALLPLEEYAHAACQKTIAKTPLLHGENNTERRRREISYLNMKWFMQTLLDRMDRTSMHAGLEARVPFADHRIVEYLWNVPWEMKCKDGVVKGLLRAAAKGILPGEILYRKKNPYPKTYDPAYENLLHTAIIEVLSDTRSPLRELVSLDKTLEFIQHPSDYSRPFYGQLMAGPQLLAYLLQVNYWLAKYKVELLI